MTSNVFNDFDQRLSQCWRDIPRGELGGLAFDLDRTLAPVGKEIDRSLLILFDQILSETDLCLAFITGSSFVRSLWNRVALPLWKWLEEKGKLQLLERVYLYGDGGAATARFNLDSPQAARHLDSSSEEYLKKYAFSPEVEEILPLFQTRLDALLKPFQRELSRPQIVPTAEGCLLQPLEVHSLRGQRAAQKAAEELERKAEEEGLGWEIHLNLWGGHIEIRGDWEESYLNNVLEDYSLAYPQVGLRRLDHIPTQLLIKPIAPLENKDVRQMIYNRLPSLLKELGLEDVRAIIAGRTAIDLLRAGCSKATALEDFQNHLAGEVIYFGDEMAEGNDRHACEVEGVFPISVGPESERKGKGYLWLGGGEEGVKVFLERYLED